ncbi:hypothetical protein ACE0DR_22430 [Azotobacter sp. CWF10]
MKIDMPWCRVGKERQRTADSVEKLPSAGFRAISEGSYPLPSDGKLLFIRDFLETDFLLSAWLYEKTEFFNRIGQKLTVASRDRTAVSSGFLPFHCSSVGQDHGNGEQPFASVGCWLSRLAVQRAADWALGHRSPRESEAQIAQQAASNLTNLVVQFQGFTIGHL